jgi:HK97 family phage major capsid protein
MVQLARSAHLQARGLTPDEQLEWNRLDSEFTSREHAITRAEQRERAPDALRKDLRDFLTKRPGDWSPGLRENANRTMTEARAITGSAMEARAISGSAAALLVAEDFMPEVDQALAAHSAIIRAGRIEQTETGADLPWPKVDDTSNIGELLADGSATADDVDPTYAQIKLQSFLYSSKLVRVPLQLMTDSGVDFASHLFDVLGQRIGRIFNTHGTTGDGSSKPRGLITALLADTTPVAAAGATAITYNDVLDLEHSVDPDYRIQRGCGFMFHDNILKALKKILDTAGRPIFLPASDTPGSTPTILGYPYFVNQDMDDSIASGKETIVFGQLKKYVIRRGGPMLLVRTDERYAEYFQAGVVAFDRLDGDLVSGGSTAVRVLQQP